MDERRRIRRVAVQFDAELINGAGLAASATIRNLSPGGVLVQGGPALKAHVCDYPGRDPVRDGAEVELRCRLPGEAQGFTCHCRLVYLRRQSQQVIEFGFRFVGLAGVPASGLRRFLAAGEPRLASNAN